MWIPNVNASKVVKVMKVLPPYPRKAVKDWSINNFAFVYKWFCYIAKVQHHMVLACDQANAIYGSLSEYIYIKLTPREICTMCIDYLFKIFNYSIFTYYLLKLFDFTGDCVVQSFFFLK